MTDIFKKIELFLYELKYIHTNRKTSLKPRRSFLSTFLGENKKKSKKKIFRKKKKFREIFFFAKIQKKYAKINSF